MSENLIKVFDYLGEKFGVAIDWTSQNVMPYVQDLSNRIIRYEILTSTFWIAVGLIGFIISAIGFKQCLKSDDSEDREVVFLPFILGIMCVVIIGAQALDIIQAICIPEKTILDMISTLNLK